MKTHILILSAIIATAITLPAQSILTTPVETPPQRTARETVESVQAARTSLLGIVRHGVDVLWGSPDPQAALDELGPRAAEVILLYQSLVTYLTTILTQAGDTASLAELQSIASRVPPLSETPEPGTMKINQDGTVTITPPEPEEE